MMLHHTRSGATLIELLMFVAIIGVVMTVTFPLLFTSTETRMLQQTIALTEQNATQAMQNIGLRVRDAETVLLPAAGETGSVLVLQLGDSERNPVIIGVSSGILIIAEHTTREEITSEQVSIQNFVVRTIESASGRQSVDVTFDAERSIRLQQPKSYIQHFTSTIRLNPDDHWIDDGCLCPAPSCSAADEFSWQICQEGSCYLAQTHLECAP